MAIEGYDLMMLGILAAAAVLGYFKGIVWQIAWIAGIVASGFVAFRFAPNVAPFIGQQAPWNRLVALLLLYVGTSLVIWLLFRVVSGAISAVHLSAFDHQLGLLFGLAKGALLCIVITFFAVTMAPGYRGQILNSRSGQIVATIIDKSDELLPKDFAESVDPFVKQFQERLRSGTAAVTAPGQPSPLQAMWEGVTSTSAWTGPAEQGGSAAVQAAGQPPGSSGWSTVPAGGFVPPAGQLPPTRPAGFAPVPPPAAGGFANPPPSPPRPVAPTPAPGSFPVGARSPLPAR